MGWQQSEAAPEKFEEKSVKSEGGVLNRFLRGKSDEFARTLAFVTTLSFGGEKETGPKTVDTMKEKSPMEKDAAFLEKLYNLPDNSSAVNPVQNEILKARAARSLIHVYALEKKGFTKGTVTPKDIKKTLDDLNNASGTFANKMFGNNDGKPTPDNMNKLIEKLPTNTGLKTFMEMHQQFQETK